MSKRTIVKQQQGIFSLPDGVSGTLTTDVVRPEIFARIGGQGVELGSISAYRPLIHFQILPASVLNKVKAELVIRTFATDGAWESNSFLASFPPGSKDISGALFQNRGAFEYDGEFDGMFQAELKLTNLTGAPLTAAWSMSVCSKPAPE